MYALRSLPPRRRLFLAVLAAVLLLVGGGIAAAQAHSGAGPVDQSRPGPVLLVPGYGGSTSSLQPLATRLRAGGRTATVVDLPDGGVGDLKAQADTLGAAVDSALRSSNAGSVDIVGYSAGGVVARLWVKEHGGDRVRRVVTLGSPHHGTTVAALAASVLGGCDAACTQLAPGSSLLRDLNRGDETPSGPEWVAIWTAADTTVTPPESGELAGALDIRVQDVCPTSRVAHGDLPRDADVQALVLSALGTAEPKAPTTGCVS